ncbi:hypothetical protein [uncultured Sphingomonas sp.]|uniref:hypothetical protein n=1 Tax=uncultured Sphingomonas sp. TaxID=158754 RepID=UPI0025F39B42|nr:hypothetical protein [uncultured Sphingomonas sp.]
MMIISDDSADTVSQISTKAPAITSLSTSRLNARTVGPIPAESVYSLDRQWSCRLRP